MSTTSEEDSESTSSSTTYSEEETETSLADIRRRLENGDSSIRAAALNDLRRLHADTPDALVSLIPDLLMIGMDATEMRNVVAFLTELAKNTPDLLYAHFSTIIAYCTELSLLSNDVSQAWAAMECVAVLVERAPNRVGPRQLHKICMSFLTVEEMLAEQSSLAMNKDNDDAAVGAFPLDQTPPCRIVRALKGPGLLIENLIRMAQDRLEDKDDWKGRYTAVTLLQLCAFEDAGNDLIIHKITDCLKDNHPLVCLTAIRSIIWLVRTTTLQYSQVVLDALVRALSNPPRVAAAAAFAAVCCIENWPESFDYLDPIMRGIVDCLQENHMSLIFEKKRVILGQLLRSVVSIGEIDMPTMMEYRESLSGMLKTIDREDIAWDCCRYILQLLDKSRDNENHQEDENEAPPSYYSIYGATLDRRGHESEEEKTDSNVETVVDDVTTTLKNLNVEGRDGSATEDKISPLAPIDQLYYSELPMLLEKLGAELAEVATAAADSIDDFIEESTKDSLGHVLRPLVNALHGQATEQYKSRVLDQVVRFIASVGQRNKRLLIDNKKWLVDPLMSFYRGEDANLFDAATKCLKIMGNAIGKEEMISEGFKDKELKQIVGSEDGEEKKEKDEEKKSKKEETTMDGRSRRIRRPVERLQVNPRKKNHDK